MRIGVIADVNLSEQQVTDIDEPVKINAVTVNASDYDLSDTDHSQDTNDEENATRLTAEQATQMELNESSIERGGNGTFTFEAEDDEATTTIPSEERVRIDLQPENRTVADD